jgi:hypothetical protein
VPRGTALIHATRDWVDRKLDEMRADMRKTLDKAMDDLRRETRAAINRALPTDDTLIDFEELRRARRAQASPNGGTFTAFHET